MSHTHRFAPAIVSVTVTLFAVLATVMSAAPAFAHDRLVSASPAENESLDAAPTEVVLEFSGEILDTGSLVRVTNANGDSVTRGELVLNGRTVTQPLTADLPTGQYQIVWRVVSEDGHPITDKYQFAIGEPVKAMVDADADENNTNAAESDADTQDTVTTQGGTENDWLRIAGVALIGAFAAVGIYATVLALKKRNNTNNTSQKDK